METLTSQLQETSTGGVTLDYGELLIWLILVHVMISVVLVITSCLIYCCCREARGSKVGLVMTCIYTVGFGVGTGVVGIYLFNDTGSTTSYLGYAVASTIYILLAIVLFLVLIRKRLAKTLRKCFHRLAVKCGGVPYISGLGQDPEIDGHAGTSFQVIPQTAEEKSKRIKLDLQRIKQTLMNSYMRNGMRNFKSQERHLKALGDVYRRKFNEDKNWVHAFKAFSLYITADGSSNDRVNDDAWGVIKDFLDKECNISKEQFLNSVCMLQSKLERIRLHLKQEMNTITEQTQQAIEDFVKKSSGFMQEFCGLVADMSVECLKTKSPCGFCVVGIGSLARGEATPYSDIEYLFLIEDEAHEKYFERLAVVTYFYIGALGETKLSSVDITELKDWFVDVRPHGYQIDGITRSSGNVPTRHSDKPNEFIKTPQALLEIYKQVLQNPSKDALRGDITAMLRFTCPIYSTEEGDLLLDQFSEGRNEVDKTMNSKRQELNMSMFCSDLERYSLFPEYDEYSAGFTLDIKKNLYRFPSLLLLNIAIVLQLTQESSWSTLVYLERTQSPVATHLRKFLAFACYSRLQCYLSMFCSQSEFEIGSRGEISAEFAGAGQGLKCLVYGKRNLWKMARTEFQKLCSSLLCIQNHFGVQIHTSEAMKRLIKVDIISDPTNHLFARFFTCDWMAFARMQPGITESKENLKVLYARARSLFQMGDFKNAEQQYRSLLEINDGTAKMKILTPEILRGRARCFEAMGKLQEAYESLLKAQKCYVEKEHKDKVQILLQLELTSLQMKLFPERKSRLDELFNILKDLILFTATQGKCLSRKQNEPVEHDLDSHAEADALIGPFDDAGYQGRLKYVNNPSRETAHCLFLIAQILQLEDKRTSQKYFSKARSLDLKMVIDQQTDGPTKVTILHDLGRKYKSSKFMSLARRLLKLVVPASEATTQIEADILVLSQAELSTLSSCQVSEITDGTEESELDELVGDAFQSDEEETVRLLNTDPDRFLDLTEEKLTQSGIDPNHVAIGTLNKIKGDVAAKQKNTQKAHECYQNANDVFEENECKTEVAAVSKADADVYAEEKDWEKADESYSKAQAQLKEVKNNSPEYLDVLNKRRDVLNALGNTDQSEELRKKSEIIEAQMELERQKLEEDAERNKQKEEEIEARLNEYLDDIKVEIQQLGGDRYPECFGNFRTVIEDMKRPAQL